MKWTGVSAGVAAMHVLRAAQPELAPARPEDALRLTPAQTAAVSRARDALAGWRLVLIADGVGSGKSFIALQLIRDALAAGHSVLLTTPASLGPAWRRLLGRGSAVTWLSHTRLSLDDTRVVSAGSPDCIVVDEAHAFRNPATRRYRTLARLAVSARLVLLTATPVNNSLLDLYFLLRLGLSDNAFMELGIPHLGDAMRTAAADAGALSPALRNALDRLVIRRGREAMREAGLGELRFPKRAAPIAVRYVLGGARQGFIPRVLESVGEMEFAALEPGRSTGTAQLLGIMLLKRLESGVAAFSATLAGLIRFHTLFLEGLAAGRLLRPGDARPSGRSDDRTTQLLLAPLLGDRVPRGMDADRLAMRAGADLHRLLELQAALRSKPDSDGKLDALESLLDGPLSGRRVLLFTEFRETASALWMRLRSRGGVGRIDGSNAWLGDGRASRLEVVRSFAPLANGARSPPARERIHLLIATDVLAEGLNLQDADTVVNYDLPWNPVRLIQRVGRIDRLGSPHDTVDCYNFIPDRHLDDYIALLDRLASKLQAIRAALGDDPAVMPLPQAAFLDRLARGDPTVLEDPGTPQDPWSELRTALDGHAAQDTPGVPVASLGNVTGRPSAVVFAVRDTRGLRFVRVVRGRVEPLPQVQAIRMLVEAVLASPGPSPSAGDHTSCLDNAVARIRGAAGQPAPLHAASTAGSAARRVLSIVRQVPDSPELATRADQLLRRLVRGLRSGEEVATRAWLARAPRGLASLPDVERLLDELEAGLGPLPDAGRSPEFIAAFLQSSRP